MSREEIMKAINLSDEVTQKCFYDLLEQLSRPLESLSPNDWDVAYTTTLEMVRDYREKSA